VFVADYLPLISSTVFVHFLVVSRMKKYRIHEKKQTFQTCYV
jgi:hypothetical protein